MGSRFPWITLVGTVDRICGSTRVPSGVVAAVHVSGSSCGPSSGIRSPAT
jgi:hypothetical protein